MPAVSKEGIMTEAKPATDEQLKIWQERPCGDTQCRCTELHLDQAIARIEQDRAALDAERERNKNLELMVEAHIGTESMCRMEHQRVQYSHNENEDPNDERCPMCRVIDILAAERKRRWELQAALVRLRDCDWVISYPVHSVWQDIARAALAKAEQHDRDLEVGK